jgi:hypothetical protein
MADSTTPAPAWTRPAAPDRHPLNRPVAPPLCRSRGHRPASTVRGHAGTGAAESTILAMRVEIPTTPVTPDQPVVPSEPVTPAAPTPDREAPATPAEPPDAPPPDDPLPLQPDEQPSES